MIMTAVAVNPTGSQNALPILHLASPREPQVQALHRGYSLAGMYSSQNEAFFAVVAIIIFPSM